MVQKKTWTTRCLFALAISASQIAPLWAAEPIHQTFVGSVSYNPYVQKPWEPITIGAVTVRISESENEIVVSGRDKRNRAWDAYVKTAVGTGYSRAWVANLDEDDTADFIFVHHNTLNGRCPDHIRLTTILFDGDGRPLPWEIEGTFRVEPGGTNVGRGVLDLGDWNQNGRAELVQTTCLGYHYQDLPYTPYGLSAVYEAQAGLWRRLSSSDRARQDATYREVAASGVRKLLPDAEESGGIGERGAFAPDYSNDRGRGRIGQVATFMPELEGDERGTANCGVLRDFEVEGGRPFVEKSPEDKLKTRERCEAHVVLEDGTVCFGRPGIVLMRSDKTVVVLNRESERAESLLKQIIEEKLPVTLTGQLEEGVCSPSLIWANEP